MSRGIIGAILGLIVGWMLASMLQGVLGRVGINGLLVLLAVIAGGVLGFGVAGVMGALIGGILGVILGGVIVGLFFSLVRLAAMVFGAVLGWQLATGQR